MSRPRYDWWGYAKGMIRRYPALCQQSNAEHTYYSSPAISGMPSAGKLSDPTAREAMRTLSNVNQRELDAVDRAVQATSTMRDGSLRLAMVDMVFWQRSHTLDGAAMQLHVSERTIRRWHTDFIYCVAKNFGLL